MAKLISGAFIKDRIYIPRGQLKFSRVKKHYEFRMFKESVCQKCEVFKNGERFNDICATCPAYMGVFQMWNKKNINGKDYITLHKGYKEQVEKRLNIDLSKIKDKRACPKMFHKLKLTKKLFKDQKEKVEGGYIKRVNQIRLIKGWLKNPQGVILAPARSGKCVVAGTLISTTNGFMPIEKLVSVGGDVKVATHKKARKVSKFYKKKTNETIKIETHDGFSIEGTPEHKLLVFTSDLRYVWRRLDKLQLDDTVCLSKNAVWSTKKYITKELARLFGYIIANANIRNERIIISTNNQVVLKDITKILQNLNQKAFIGINKGVNFVAFYNKNLINQFVELGLCIEKASKKEIPWSVLESNKSIIKAFVSAYITCDSYIANNEIQLCSASKKLIDQLQTILLAFGLVGSKKDKESYARNSNNPKIKTYYSLYFRGQSRKKFLNIFLINKPYTLGAKTDIGKYLVDGIPYVRQELIKFVSTYKQTNNRFLVNGKQVYLKLSDWTDPRKVLITKKGLHIVKTKLNLIKKIDNNFALKLKKVISKTNSALYQKIESITRKVNTKNVYDITVPKTHAYVANGIVSHNTVIGTACLRALRTKTLVVAHESTLLDQFYETIYSFTNAKKLERKSKRKVAVLIKSMDDFNIPADIYLTTYQKFIQPKTSKKRIKKYLKGKFGLVIFDETHLCAAPAFSKFAAGLDSKYVLGLTATYERKDGHEKVVEAIIGPVRIEGKSVGMKPVVEIHDTKLGPKYEWKGMQAYTKAVTWTANNKERNKQIVKRVFADLRANKKHNIIIPIERRNQARLLVEMINRQAEYNRDNKGEKWAVRLAREYIGGVDKKKVLSYMKEGKGTRVLVAMRKMCKLGLNLEPLTHMHLQIPINNAPDFYQLTQRICTFYPGKPQPKLIMYVDNIGISRGCFTASWWNGVVKLKYKYSQATAEQAKLISSANRPNLRSDYFARRYVGGGGQRRSTGPTIHKASWGV